MSKPEPAGASDESPTAKRAYADRLATLERRGIRRLIDVQAPYRWNLRRFRLGRVLDVGCGLGRNLVSLDAGSVGVDHNAESIRIARERGLTAYTSDEFFSGGVAEPKSFDTLLFAHVLEHLPDADGLDLVRAYLPFLKDGGRLCFITPQPRGYRSDATHVTYIDLDGLRVRARRLGAEVERALSFPLPRVFGQVFTYNEFVVVARWPGETGAADTVTGAA
ncbi:class I SAM-dependent methyltransferase [Agromyces aerolatus]|uniref:class I SAM-dependent methyltransferase n=1 Tax=Agromyces sp. LY-1074 TaxID=3074080 RepID=UPI00285AE6A8|nr:MULTISPECIES: class I SAM-dependent methyltransferase [unclassified Agromyces]MDR5700379.1 class I SAM-dependent methyltransferase [Agromyces sp. LY-1074]MDR5706643.1 class I SAM-dependent methyltransferase [Agromyces sp. LY-1358]